MTDKVIIARQLFVSCEKVSHWKYVILNDGHFIHEFVAKNEDTAQIYFQGFLKGVKYERERRNTQLKFEIIEYELEGNAEEGYEVNSAWHTLRYIEVSEKCTKDEILDALSEEEYELPDNVSIFGESDFTLYLEDEHGKPLLELHRQ